MPAYQSKSFTFLRQQFLRMRDTAARSVRQGSLLATWTLQIVLYPIYLVFQSSRVIGRQLQSSVRRAVPRLKAVGDAIDHVLHPEKPPSLSFTTDTPLKNLLRSLPADIPNLIQADIEGPYLALSAGQAIPALQRGTSLAIAPTLSSLEADDQFAQAVIRSELLSPLSTVQTTAQNGVTSKTEGIPIQGMASVLGDRHLVLIGIGNHVLDILSPDQQQRLKERIVLEVSLYRQRQQELLPSPSTPWRRLPLPQINDRQWLPVQWFRRVMAWMQTGDVAIATNLFQEALALPTHPFARNQGFPRLRSISPWDWHRLPSSSQMLMQTFNSGIQPFQPTKTTLLPPANTRSALSPQPSPSGLSVLWSRLVTWFNLPVWQESPSESELELLSWQSSNAIAQSRTASLAKFKSGFKGEISVARKGDRSQSIPNPSASAKIAAFPTSDEPTDEPTSLQPISSTETSVEAQPEWVETSAIVVGYAKHPLEVILGWLDLGVAWIEQRVTRLWQWLTGNEPTPPDA